MGGEGPVSADRADYQEVIHPSADDTGPSGRMVVCLCLRQAGPARGQIHGCGSSRYKGCVRGLIDRGRWGCNCDRQCSMVRMGIGVGVARWLGAGVYTDTGQLLLNFTCFFNQFFQGLRVRVVDEGFKQLVT